MGLSGFRFRVPLPTWPSWPPSGVRRSRRGQLAAGRGDRLGPGGSAGRRGGHPTGISNRCCCCMQLSGPCSVRSSSRRVAICARNSGVALSPRGRIPVTGRLSRLRSDSADCRRSHWVPHQPQGMRGPQVFDGQDAKPDELPAPAVHAYEWTPSTKSPNRPVGFDLNQLTPTRAISPFRSYFTGL